MNRKLTVLDDKIGVFRVVKDLGMVALYEGKPKRRMATLACPYCESEFDLMIDSAKKKSSCGCKTNEMKGSSSISHGECKTRLYRIWIGMKARVYNPKDGYEKEIYGNISISDEFLDYVKFSKWSKSNGYLDNLSIDRIDPRGNYEASNCRWATRSEQSSNILRGKRNRVLPKGVTEQNGLYRSRITVSGHRSELGVFSTVVGAMNAYNNYIKNNKLEDTYPLSVI